MKHLFLGLSLIMLGQTSCKKDNPTAGEQLPDTSSSGKNFLACKVNGKVHVYSGQRSYTISNGVNFAFFNNGYLELYADEVEYDDALLIAVASTASPLRKDSTYIFSAESENSMAQYFKVKPTFLTYNSQNGSGWIRFSRLDSVASGTFEFTAYYDQRSYGLEEPDTVRVTEGRFDISKAQ